MIATSYSAIDSDMHSAVLSSSVDCNMHHAGLSSSIGSNVLNNVN